MKQSLTYYIILFILKLKGIKKDFSKDPIDVERIRKSDIHQSKSRFFRQNQIRKFNVSKSRITEVALHENPEGLVLFIHGGAFISGPTQHHWDAVQSIAQKTNKTVWMCDYPKAPEHKITEISENIDAVYTTALAQFAGKEIILIGDSVGGTLITALVQRLVKSNLQLPHKTILVSPVMDASLCHPEIEKIDPIDPMLSRTGVLSAKKMCAENNDLKNPMISPLYGSFKNFPSTILYLAENDITYPDQKLAVQKFIDDKVSIKVIEGENMPHIWPFLPVMKEAKLSFAEMIQLIKD